jgi:Domain of unknown function (DUF4293)
MIQRIQTLYLLAALGLIILVFFLPVSEFISGNNQLITFKAIGFYDERTGNLIIATIPVIIIVSVIIFLYIISIFLFKKRMIQMRLCVFNIILLVGLIGLYCYHLVFFIKTDYGTDFKIGISFILPVLSIILTYLALRGIRKDEYLVKLADRIR